GVHSHSHENTQVRGRMAQRPGAREGQTAGARPLPDLRWLFPGGEDPRARALPLPPR
ncbi:unnamed protein product, partial [Heterosigma akashiwo]